MNYTEDQLTPWINGKIPPFRPGVYMRRASIKNTPMSNDAIEGFAWWDGRLWHSMVSRLDLAKKIYGPSGFQLSSESSWRGLNFDPAKKGKRK